MAKEFLYVNCILLVLVKELPQNKEKQKVVFQSVEQGIIWVIKDGYLICDSGF